MQLCPKEVCNGSPGRSNSCAWQCESCTAGSPSLTPLQLDKLVISQLGLLAQRRLARGVKLNKSEATVCTDADYAEIKVVTHSTRPSSQTTSKRYLSCVHACL